MMSCNYPQNWEWFVKTTRILTTLGKGSSSLKLALFNLWNHQIFHHHFLGSYICWVTFFPFLRKTLRNKSSPSFTASIPDRWFFLHQPYVHLTNHPCLLGPEDYVRIFCLGCFPFAIPDSSGGARNHKLTMLMQDSLGGSVRASPAHGSHPENTRFLGPLKWWVWKGNSPKISRKTLGWWNI